MGVSMDGGLQAGLSGLTHAFPCCKLKIEARRLSMDGLEYLKKDHDRFRQLFRHAENAKNVNEKWRIFRVIKQELDLHAQAEEAVLYPSFRNAEGFAEIIAHSRDEHQEMKNLMEEMTREKNEEDFEDDLDELIESALDHVEDEETELFPKVRNLASEAELEVLGRKLEEAKKSDLTKQAA